MNYAIPKTASEEMGIFLMILGVLYIETNRIKRLNPY